MELCVSVSPDHLEYLVDLPSSFLNHLLEDGYQFDQGVLCLELSTKFGRCYSCMRQFKGFDESSTLDISYHHNRHLNTIDGEYVHVRKVEPVVPHLIRLQAHRESFATVINCKEQLEQLLLRVKIIHQGDVFTILSSQGEEPFTVSAILDEAEQQLEWGLVVEADVKVDFMQTLEAIEREQERERKEQEERERKRSEERRVGKECRSRWSPYH